MEKAKVAVFRSLHPAYIAIPGLILIFVSIVVLGLPNVMQWESQANLPRLSGTPLPTRHEAESSWKQVPTTAARPPSQSEQTDAGSMGSSWTPRYRNRGPLMAADRVLEGSLPATPAGGRRDGNPTASMEAAAAPTETTAPISYGPPVRITIPAINVDYPVKEVGVRDGTYEVPAWSVGHHSDSALPGAPGNSVYNGHLDHLIEGWVFARLKEVNPGDMVYLFTATHRTEWVVTEKKLLQRPDSSFLDDTTEPRITLYTCGGTLDWATQSYSGWLVVTGALIRVTPL